MNWSRLLTKIEYRLVKLGAHLFGLRFVVRYLRNPNPDLTVRLLRDYGGLIGESTTIKGSIHLDNAIEDQNSTGDFSNLRVGENCYIGDGVFFDLANRILVHDSVVISGRVSILTHADCNRSAIVSSYFPRRCEPVTISEGAWIGFGATILTGVDIGCNAVVSANSIIKHPVVSNTLVGVKSVSSIKDLKEK